MDEGRGRERATAIKGEKNMSVQQREMCFYSRLEKILQHSDVEMHLLGFQFTDNAAYKLLFGR